jgi:6-phosphofructokinase 1
LVAERQFGTMVGWQGRSVVSVPLEQVCIGPRSLDPCGTMVGTARGLGIYVGEEICPVEDPAAVI